MPKNAVIFLMVMALFIILGYASNEYAVLSAAREARKEAKRLGMDNDITIEMACNSFRLSTNKCIPYIHICYDNDVADIEKKRIGSTIVLLLFGHHIFTYEIESRMYSIL